MSSYAEFLARKAQRAQPIGPQVQPSSCHPRELGGTIMQPEDDEPRPNMRYGMPASWEDMLTLGLNPTTGEPA